MLEHICNASLQKMGALLCHKKAINVVVIGQYASGKTAILYRMKMRKFIQTIPTVGYSTVEFKLGSQSIMAVDLSELPYFNNCVSRQQGVVFVYDPTVQETCE